MAERIRRTQKEILRDKLVKIDGEIDKASAALKRLKNERSQHEKELNDLEMGEVVELIRSSNITTQELQNLVADHVRRKK
ncbi:MAG: hypothetical protein HFG43_11065 [Lachnospiraceae bacterium]|nr:hypothetical protein [Lachnospiraceae bacterium]MCI9591718.1 hypothetical protein [Lachnospiraceae bacterium]